MGEPTFSVGDYAAISLPKKPRLAPWLTPVLLGDDRLQFRASGFAFTLRGPLFLEVFQSIQPILDGTHSVKEISATGGDSILPTTIQYVLRMLRAHGALQEGDPTPPEGFDEEDLSRYDALIQFLSRFLKEPAAALGHLGQVQIAVSGTGPLVSAVRDSLLSCGIKKNKEIQFKSPHNSPEALKQSAADLQGVDFLLACQESEGFGFFERINSICLESGTRWIRLSVDGPSAFLGPMIVPRQTACYVCYQGRLATHAPELADYLAYQKEANRQNAPDPLPGLDPLRSSLAGQAALELVRIITGFAPPATVSRFFEIKASSPETQGHDVLRLPQCPACNPRGPHQEAWSRQFKMGEGH